MVDERWNELEDGTPIYTNTNIRSKKDQEHFVFNKQMGHRVITLDNIKDILLRFFRSES